MSTVISRTVASTPQRTASKTWSKIVELVAPSSESAARAELEKVRGIAASSISSEAPKDDAFVFYGGGPRVRVYCAFGDDAITGDGLNEEPLAQAPTEGDWRLSVPCPPDDLAWTQRELKRLSTRVTARAIGESVEGDDDKPKQDASARSSEAQIDLKEFFRP